jgi:hypothetical protein
VTGEDIEARLRPGCVKGPDHRVSDDGWLLERSEMPESRENFEAAVRKALHHQLQGGGAEAVAFGAAGEHHGAVDRGELGEGRMAEAALVDQRLVLAPTPEPDRAVGQVFEAELDVGGEGFGVKDVERRLRA